METASGLDLLLTAVANGGREFVFEIAPWIFVWLLIAYPFVWLLRRFKKEKMGGIGIIIWVMTFTAVIAGICAAIHGVLAFGEAFGSAINHNRVRAFVVLTAAFPLVAGWFAFRRPKNEKQA